MDIHSRSVLTFRWAVLLLAGIYCLDQLFFGRWGGAGGPFRYLTIWALFLSLFCAWRMLARSRQRSTRGFEVTAMCCAVLNVMVVILYWRLYLIDPDLVNNDGKIIWYREFYLHGLGPALQIADALLIGRVFRRPWRAALPLAGIVLAYVAWSELFVGPFNDAPEGTVTSGLPYPFLNNLDWPERAQFYAMNGATALILLAVFGVVAAVLYRFVLARRA